ncbi:MAG: prephenate dehydratase [Candidatus Saliniplasma sp.]
MVKRVKREDRKKATLGPAGTYSEMAAESWPGGEVLLKDGPEEVIDHVKEGGLGVLPIENSINGTVLRTLDLLITNHVMIKGEIMSRIEHCIIGDKSGGNIEKIVSHPQALAQCRIYLKDRFPDAKLQGVESTAEAVHIVRERCGTAAVASERAAERYDLYVLESSVQDVKTNVTRFFVLDSEDAGMTGIDKTSIIFYVQNRPGALYDALGAFAREGINLTKLESRPSKQKLGDYLFIVDFKGHRKEDKVRSALKKLNEKTRYVKLLGSYPQGEKING